MFKVDRVGLGVVYVDGQPVDSRSVAGIGTLDSGYDVLIGQSNNGAYAEAGTSRSTTSASGVGC